MGKASRKVERYNDLKKDEITQEEIKEQYGQKSITGKIIEGLNLFYWVGISQNDMVSNAINMFIMIACYLVSTLTVEKYLRTITTVASATILAHGVFTALLITVVFSFFKRPKGVEKPTVEQFLYRFVGLGLALGLVLTVFTVYVFK